MSDVKPEQTASTEKKEFPGEFISDLKGTIKTVNTGDWGIRGILVTETNEDYIYVINYDKIPKQQIPLLTKGDKIQLTRVYVTIYDKGKITKWLGKEQAKVCKNGAVHILEKAEPEHADERPLESNMQAFDNLKLKINDAKEKLTDLERIASLQTKDTLTTREFLKTSVECSLYYHRVLSSIVRILEVEE